MVGDRRREREVVSWLKGMREPLRGALPLLLYLPGPRLGRYLGTSRRECPGNRVTVEPSDESRLDGAIARRITIRVESAGHGTIANFYQLDGQNLGLARNLDVGPGTVSALE